MGHKRKGHYRKMSKAAHIKRAKHFLSLAKEWPAESPEHAHLVSIAKKHTLTAKSAR